MQFVELPRSEYIELLLSYRGDGRVKILTGLRRVGKSYILRRLFKDALLKNGVALDHIIELDLEDDESVELCQPHALRLFCESRLVDQQPHYFLIDEVQNAADFWRQLTSLRQKEQCDLYVTGSNSRLLTSDVATDFRGRSKNFEVFPLSFAEVNQYMGGDFGRDVWDAYFRYGGMPELQKETTEEGKENYLGSLYETVYYRDLVNRYNVEHPAELEMLLRYMASTTGSLVSPQRIANMFQSRGHDWMTQEKVNFYLNCFQEAQILVKAPRYDIRGQQHINSVEKYYFKDHGLRNAIVSHEQLDRGAMLETLVYNELRRQGYRVSVGVVATRPLSQELEEDTKARAYEVDFVANRAGKKFYIQCAYSLDDEALRRREVRPFQLIKDFRKRVLVYGPGWDSAAPAYDSEGVLWMPTFQLLTNRNALDF